MPDQLAKMMEAERIKRGWSYEELADRAGVPGRGNMQQYCAGSHPLPRKHLPGIARAFGWPTSGPDWERMQALHGIGVASATDRTRVTAERVASLTSLVDEARELIGLLLPSAISGEKPSEHLLERINRFISSR